MITQAFLLRGNDLQNWFTFFPEFENTLLKNAPGNVLAIFDPKPKIMRFIECDPRETVLQLVIEIPGGLAASLHLLKLLSSHISKMLYSTGFCEEGSASCYWEGFFFESALKSGSTDLLQADLNEIEAISKHEINRVEVQYSP